MPGTIAPQVSVPIGDQTIGNASDPASLPQQLAQIRQDLQTMTFVIQKQLGLTRFGGWARVSVPVAGPVRVYASSGRATAGSSGIAYHIINATRQGQAEQAYQIDTRQGELAAYTEAFLGEFQCGQGDVLRINVAVTGAPAPTLTEADFTLRCELKPA